MGLFSKLFEKKDGIATANSKNESFRENNTSTSAGLGVGNYYVFEWLIKDTGEIFYVDVGKGNEYKEYHERAYDAEKVRALYETEAKIIADRLTEEKAKEIKSQEILRIITETSDCLTNRNVTYSSKYRHPSWKSYTAPALKFETASVLYATEVEEHFFDVHHREFDPVEFENLSHCYFIDKYIHTEELQIVYGGNYEKYYNEVVSLLEANECKIIKSKYAKSVTAWIYPSEDYVLNYELDEKNAEERIGRRIPVYHLIDVWKYLKDKYGKVEQQEKKTVSINPINNRVPLSKIKNLSDWDKGFDAGYKYWEKGEEERKAGNIEKAIQLYDKARYNGYNAPALYKSYAVAYRKLKDLDNEIAILEEAIYRLRAENHSGNTKQIITFEDQKKKAEEKLLKNKKK